MANYAQTSKNFTGQYMSNLAGVNTGLVIPWGSTSIPTGFLECNGQSVSTATYAALFAVIGYTYGGAGASFNVPDLTDRTVVNKSNTKALASTGGANTVLRTGNIGGSAGSTTLTTAQIPAHSHSGMVMGMSGMGNDNEGTRGGNGGAQASNSGSAGSDQSHTHNLSATYTGSSDSVLQPYLVMVYIIKT